ncbi:AfsR/SARP family transcriptional regulator [Deinococcus misasensis]|uniref:AfsR/SARP family transcriptional regulator n=1 Tax=Deinococcus misasensis TaxID=392413 RepID=UPI0005554E6F|nr:BTAD domain-containing putative transcriptional regulator [Deinococcus misasensis]
MGRTKRSTQHHPVQVFLFGAPRIQRANRTKPLKPEKALWLLTFLAAQDRWVAREEICALLWPDAETPRARHSLRQLLQRIHSLRWTNTLQTQSDQLRWTQGSDLHEFRRCLHQREWQSALDHHTGTLLQGMSPTALEGYGLWLEEERRQLHSQWVKTATALAQQLEHQNQHDAAREVLETLLQKDPLSEHAVQHLLRLCGTVQHRALAIQHYLRFAQHLQQEMGMQPSPETVVLYQNILQEHSHWFMDSTALQSRLVNVKQGPLERI